MKKLLSTIMAVVMLLSLVPMAVATEGGAEGGAVPSNSVYEVSEAAQLIWAAKNHTGDTIKLKGNVTLSEPVKITKSVVLDLGDYKVTYGGEEDFRAIYVEDGAAVQIKATANGGVDATTIALQVNPGGKLTVDGGTYNATYAVAVFSNETETEAVLNSGTYNGFVCTNGKNKNSHVTFNGGTYNKMIYLPAGGQSSYKITDGLFNAALEIDAGQLDILGGTFKSSVDTTNNVNKPATNNNGSGAYQGIIVVCKPDGSSETGYIGDAVVNIKGGTFENTFANGETIVVADFGKDEKGVGDAKVTISGDAVVKGKIALYSSENNDGVSLAISGGAFTDLASAVKYAADGAKITLAEDTNGNGVVAAKDQFASKGLTIDFNGHTYTIGGVLVGSAGTGTNAFQLLKGNKITFKNGTIAGVTEGTKPAEDTPNWHGAPAIVIQNYCDLTLDNMTVTGGDETQYIVSTNCGKVVIKGDTNIYAKAGAYALDVMHWENDSYKDAGTSVTFDETMTGTVNGKIDVYCYRVTGKNESTGKDIWDSVPVDDNGAVLTIKGGTFTVDPSKFVTGTNLVVVPNVGKTEYTVQPKTSEDGKTTTEVSKDGKTVTETKTDGNTVTKTETNVDTGAATVTKTETKVEGNVTTKTETVTVKDDKGNVTKVTESKIVENNENGKTETKTTVDGKTVKTDVTVNQAPTTTSDVRLNAKALEGKAAGTETSSVAVNKASLSELKKDAVKDVIIETDQATLKLDKTAVTTMESNVPTNGKMTLNVTVTEEKNATTTDIEKVKVEVTAKNEAGQNVFPENTANTNGKINITIPYNGNATQLDLWYIAANGSASYMGRFPVVNGFVSFDVKHFSQYDLIPVASSGSSVIKTGAGSSAASTTQTVTTDLTPGSITKVTVDGKVVDAKYYTVSGSNVTFTAEFLKTLKNGSHTVTVENATKIAKGVFTVNNPTTAVQAPTTADAGIALYAGMAIASVMGTGVVFTSRKRKNH